MPTRSFLPMSFFPSPPIASFSKQLLRRPRFMAALMLIGGALLLPARAGEQRQFTDGSQTLEIRLPNGFQSGYGYYPVHLLAVNAGPKRATWTMRVANHYGSREGSINPQGRVEVIEVGPHQTVEREILVPIGLMLDRGYYSSVQIEVVTPSGRTEPWGLRTSSPRQDSDNKLSPVPTLISPQAAKLMSTQIPEDSGMHSTLDVQHASGDWRGYTPYSLILVTPEEWKSMPGAARGALADWTRMGGQLQFVSSQQGALPNDAPLTDLPDQAQRGLGGVHAPVTYSTQRGSSLRNLASAKTAEQQPHPASEVVSKSDIFRPWLSSRQTDLIADHFVIWPTLLVLVAFFVMMTPVNLFLLAPSRRRHRLFFTIPVIALSACVILALAVMLGDGVGGDGLRLVVVESRPGNENRQYITQWQASRCGALLGTGFVVKDAAHIAPLQSPGSDISVRVEGDRIECSGGWFTSRAIQSQQLQAVRPGRGRIEWASGNTDGTSAVSTFDFPLQDVFILRDNHTWVRATRMRQGEATRFEPVSDSEVQQFLKDKLNGVPCEKQLRQMAKRPGHFIAFTDQPPAIDTLGAVAWQDTGIVTGSILTP